MLSSSLVSIVKKILPIAVSLLMLGLGLHFLMSEGVQLTQISDALVQSDRRWLYLGIGLSAMYVWLHGLMYRESFKAIGQRVSISNMTRLYLKRNLVSVFLPAGFLASQVFFSNEIARLENTPVRTVHAASGIFSVAGLLSMVVVVLPALGWLLTANLLPGGAALAFIVMSVLLILLVWGLFDFTRKGQVYRFMQQRAPSVTARLDELDWTQFNGRYLLNAILISCLVELTGVLHLYIVGRTLGLDLSWTAAFAGYIAVLVVLMTAPFLRGMGAVEALLAFVLMRFNIAPAAAVTAALLFRFFEFWLVLLLAAPVFIFRPGSILVRIAPSLWLFLLGIVNILSGITPSLPDRVHLLYDYFPKQALHASATLTVVSGFVLLISAIYLFYGLKSAWWVALGLSIFSLISHLLKGFDYEESTLALITAGALIYQRKQYNVRTDLTLARKAWLPALIVVSTAILLGTIGFYLLDKKHFGADFTFLESARFAVQSFVMAEPTGLEPHTMFGGRFLWMMHVLGGMTLMLIAFAIFRPFLPQFEPEESARERALQLVKEHGNSALDYFKTYADKQYFFPQNGQSFVSYKSTPRYAIALEDPVAPDQAALKESVLEFDRFCHRNGLRSIYYRIPAESAPLYRSMGKLLFPLGEEAVVELANFNLDGKERKSLRNSINKMEKEGYMFKAYRAPLRDGLLQQLRAVSDAWLRHMDRSEMGFSQGVFDEAEIKQQTVLTLENQEGKIWAFINLIPGATPKEANFDLMRRTEDSPSTTMDYLFVKMFQFLQSEGFTACNLGLVPLSGVETPANFPESLIKLAYNRVPRFSGYKSLRHFKEKFSPTWHARYIAYDHQMDLVNLPVALAKVVRQ
ncbi:MAG: phosphatidylglycerol lysyltransferase domain-containing protein [Bacteroidota bacterium]